MESVQQRLIKAPEAAKVLDLRLPRLYELTRQGRIPCVRFGDKSLRFDISALEKFIKNGGVQQAAVNENTTGV